MKDKNSKGTFFKRKLGKWEAKIRLNPKTYSGENTVDPIDVSLGYYDTKEEARMVYRKALALKHETMIELADILRREFQKYPRV